MEKHSVMNDHMHTEQFLILPNCILFVFFIYFLRYVNRDFLHIDDYPPDANQGFDILSAAISLPNFHASLFFPSNE
jgi:hypothetical protein